MSPSGGLQKCSSGYLKKHLQLGEGMKRMTTPLLLMSAGASLISLCGLQKLLPQFLLSLYFSVAYSMCICLQVIAILAFYACRGYKTQDVFTQAGVISHHLVSVPSHLAYDHRPPNWNHHVLVPSTLSTSFRLWEGLKAACHRTPSSFIAQHIAWREQLLLSTLFSSLHKRFIIFSEIEIVTAIQLFTQSSSCADLRRYAANACSVLSANTAYNTQWELRQAVNSTLE